MNNGLTMKFRLVTFPKLTLFQISLQLFKRIMINKREIKSYPIHNLTFYIAMLRLSKKTSFNRSNRKDERSIFTYKI